VGGWTLDPLQLAALALPALAYARRARTLRLRGTPVPAWRRLSFAIGIALLFVALVSPVAELAEEWFFSFHMAQHLLLGDLAPLALLAGLSGPVLRPLLALRVVMRLRFLVHPAVALALWTLNLCVWHLPALYDAALQNSAVHALEHLSFFGAGMLMWGAVLEVLPGPAWFGSGAKLGYVVVVRLIGTVIANVFVWTDSVLYPTYEHAGEHWGISPAADQGIAGGLMMIEGSVVTIAAFAWLFLRLASEGELRQDLIERGLDEQTVSRAVRYGRGREMTEPR
jgi:putative membrane protein